MKRLRAEKRTLVDADGCPIRLHSTFHRYRPLVAARTMVVSAPAIGPPVAPDEAQHTPADSLEWPSIASSWGEGRVQARRRSCLVRHISAVVRTGSRGPDGWRDDRRDRRHSNRLHRRCAASRDHHRCQRCAHGAAHHSVSSGRLISLVGPAARHVPAVVRALRLRLRQTRRYSRQSRGDIHGGRFTGHGPARCNRDGQGRRWRRRSASHHGCDGVRRRRAGPPARRSHNRLDSRRDTGRAAHALRRRRQHGVRGGPVQRIRNERLQPPDDRRHQRKRYESIRIRARLRHVHERVGRHGRIRPGMVLARPAHAVHHEVGCESVRRHVLRGVRAWQLAVAQHRRAADRAGRPRRRGTPGQRGEPAAELSRSER